MSLVILYLIVDKRKTYHSFLGVPPDKGLYFLVFKEIHLGGDNGADVQFAQFLLNPSAKG